MQLIMENWRGKVLNEIENHSNEYIAQVTVGEFLNIFPSVQLRTLEAELNKKFPDNEKLFSRITGKIKALGVGEAVDWVGDNAKAIATTAVVGGSVASGGSLAVAAPILGYITNKVVGAGVDLIKGKAAAMLQSLSIPDDGIQTNAQHLTDLDDEFVKILRGPDGSLDRQELQALQVGLKELLRVWDTIQEDVNKRTKAGEVINDEWRNKTMNEFGMQDTFNNEVKKAYSAMIKLGKDVQIPRERQ